MASILNAGRQQAGLSVTDLWIDCFGLGWTGTEADLTDVLLGDRIPSGHEYDEIAQAINDKFIELGHDHPVPYAEDL